MRIAPIVLALLLAGCREVSSREGVEQDAGSAAPSSSLMPIATLEGEWRVAGIDGAPFDEPYGLALSADADEIWWEPRCSGMARRYRITGLGIVTDKARPPAPVLTGQPSRPICTINPPERVQDVLRALDVADTVGRTPQNGVLLSGGGHSLLLFSQ
ncbi:hypothetical protein [Tsuneonella amylolytica]|uniref:hypothetical protein n=1 Tax=Tsuneonella amylolytica TaxID=2338327 RepID=UPI000EA9A1AA|nr:hypothetical protein [Tsuneonella amylolytica]